IGVWSSPKTHNGPLTIESRTRFSKNAMDVAVRCTRNDTDESLVAGVTVSARIGNDEVAVLEDKTDERKKGDFDCSASAHTNTTKACEPNDVRANCFVLDGTTLTLYGSSPIESLEMTKISD